jgi:hypothetical protein
MAGSRTRSRVPPSQYKVGDSVRFKWGVTPVVGEIVEDRGNIGVGGRRLWAVHVCLGGYDDRTVTLPEEEMEPAPTPAR